MKKQWKGVCLWILIVALLVVGMGTTAVASTVRQLNASYSGIKISLDGVEFVPKDVNGTVVEPFIVDGTTYLPVRAVASALGLDVDWDGTTQTVILTTPGKEPATPSPSEDGKNHDIEITGATLDYSYGVPTLYLDYKNNTSSDIIRFDIYVLCYDAYGDQVGNVYKGYNNTEKLLANSTGSQYWSLYGYSGTQEVRFGVYKYQTADGVTVEIPEEEIKFWKKSY